MSNEVDGFVIVPNDNFVILNTEYKTFCLDIIGDDTTIMIYPFNQFIKDLLYNNTLKRLLDQCKLDFVRSDVYLDDNKITFVEFISYIKEHYHYDDIKKALVFLSQILYSKIVVEIGLLLNGLFIGELRDKTPMKYYLYRDNLFISKKVLRIFGIGKYGEDYTVKEIEIVFSCNIVDDEYVTIKVETLVG